MITNLEIEFSYGDFPTAPVAADIALEADVTEAEALAMIHAAWQQIETFVGCSYRNMTAGVCIVKVSSPMPFKWPRYPYPQCLGVEVLLKSGWANHSEIYAPELGLVDLEAFTTYRLAQIGIVTGKAPSSNVLQAVTNLALYQLIHSPTRREFKSQSAGDTSFSREQLKGVMFGSGAGALLASEVRT